jgi:hypothetical protein
VSKCGQTDRHDEADSAYLQACLAKTAKKRKLPFKFCAYKSKRVDLEQEGEGRSRGVDDISSNRRVINKRLQPQSSGQTARSGRRSSAATSGHIAHKY